MITSYDPKCGDLARYFLGEPVTPDETHNVSALALAIQGAVEDWLDEAGIEI